jgi:hypothetical protein
MDDGIVYNAEEMEVIFSCCKFLDYMWEVIKTELHAPSRCRELFHLHAKKAIRARQIVCSQKFGDGFSGNVYFGSYGLTIELNLIVRWKHLPDTLVKAIYEKPTPVN